MRWATQGQNPSRTIRCAHGPVGREGVLDAGALIAGRFRVQQLLASGGMGNIYSGYCEASDRRVVLKVPRPLNWEGDELYARFLQEVRATSLLRGEHVVHAVADGVLATGVPFLALEHLDGMDLEAVLRETGRLLLPAVSAGTGSSGFSGTQGTTGHPANGAVPKVRRCSSP